MGAFEQIILTMQQMDVFQLFFPWLLVAAVTYGALQKYEVFEEDTVTGTVALSIAFISMAGLYIFVPATMFANFGAALAFIIFGLLGLIIILSMAGIDMEQFHEIGDTPIEGNIVAGVGLLLVIVAFVGVFLNQVDIGQVIGGFEFGSDQFMQILTLIFLLLVVKFTTDSSS